MKRFILWSLSLVFLFSSCTNKTEVVEPLVATPVDNYIPMKVGNQWVYEAYRVDTETNEIVNQNICGCPQQFTTTIVGETILNGITYFEFESTGSDNDVCDTKLLRDNEGVLEDENGIPYFSATDFTSILHTHIEPGIANTASPMEYKMFDPNTPLTVTAGTFDVLEYRGTLEVLSTGEERSCSVYYANNVGQLRSTKVALSGNYIFYIDLVSYTIL